MSKEDIFGSSNNSGKDNSASELETDENGEYELSDERLIELMSKQGESMDNAGFSTSEKVIASKIADELLLTMQQYASVLEIDSSKLIARSRTEPLNIFEVGAKELGYVTIEIENGEVKMYIPPAYNKLRDIIERSVRFSFEGDGPAGPRGV